MTLQTDSPWRQAIRGMPATKENPYRGLPKAPFQHPEANSWPGGYEPTQTAYERGYERGRAEARDALGLRARKSTEASGKKDPRVLELEIALSQLAQTAAALLHDVGDCAAATGMILSLVHANHALGGENVWAPPDPDEVEQAELNVAIARQHQAETLARMEGVACTSQGATPGTSPRPTMTGSTGTR